MHRLVPSLLLLLSCCATPSSHFRDQAVTQITVEGSTFDIRLRGNLAEAIRINPQYAPRLGPLRARATRAMQEVSGCQVSGVLGDQTVMTGILNCPAESGKTD